MLRVALYARYSTGLQDELSISTQIEECRADIAVRGWQVVEVFTDPAKSGKTMHGPGMQAMMAACRRGGFDVVYADALDRLSRSQGDVATLYEQLKFRGIRLFTRNEGDITPLHIGLKGTMNAD
jgi:DNA invertase Pin-like site-specific DNA recombinase